MKTCTVCLIMMVVLMSVPGQGYAKTWYVHPDSTLSRIQVALNMCCDGDTVLVGPGTYYDNIIWPFDVQRIVLVSEHGPDSTIIDGLYLASVIRFLSPAPIKDRTTVIKGFTIQHGNAAIGGGINCSVWHSPTITDNIIQYNKAWDGAGIYTDGGIDKFTTNPLIMNNQIMCNNATSTGGGICYVWGSSPDICNNTIEKNSSVKGGGIYIHGFCSGHITANRISDNTAQQGGGIYGSWCSPVIDSCIIDNNAYAGIWFNSSTGASLVRFNDIFDNDDFGMYHDGSSQSIEADHNWWGDETGPFHAVFNPQGMGDTVSDSVDFIPWKTEPMGVEETVVQDQVENREHLTATVFSGPLVLTADKKCTVIDITGRRVDPQHIKPGVYFIRSGEGTVQKVIKAR